MGYCLYITRRRNWFDDGEPNITLQEWRAIVANDPDLELFTEDQPTSGVVASMRLRDRRGNIVKEQYFSCHDGDISVKNPHKLVLMKMIAIADQLGARVIGEYDEIYSKDGVPDRPTIFTADER
jgi:hypothetical protein